MLAVTPRDPETFYREVDEELRRDQLAGFAKRYGLMIAIAVLLVLGGIGGWLWWQNHKVAQAEQQAEKMNAIFDDIDAGKAKGLDARLDEMVKEGNDAYRAAALLTKADLAIQANNEGAAIAGFRRVAQDEDLAKPYRDLALIRQTSLEFDKLAPAQVVERLKPLAVKGNPWFGSAGEMVAIAYLKQGKRELAAPIFAAMAKDETVPQSIRRRALQMAGALGVDAVPESAATGGAGATKEASR